MMGKFFIGLVLIGALLWGFFFIKNQNNTKVSSPSEKKVTDTRSGVGANKTQISSRTLFVPYWNILNLSSAEQKYDRLIYFGVTGTEDGVNREDQGFANIQEFSDQTHSVKTLLTLRMLDSESNIALLDNKDSQQRLAQEVAEIAKKYDFSGVVLDLELSVIPFSNVKSQISDFVKTLDSELESQSLTFSVALYGDTYFRARPYDVRLIGESADEILIMAYDFHKSRGEPGPNYPLSKGEVYGYDYKNMIEDFSSDVDTEKLNVIFGMYGYKWTLGKQGKPLKAATAFSLKDAEEMFYPKCNYKSCSVNRDSNSAETKVTYIDTEGYKNEAWFEDEESVEKKSKYIEEQEIGKISYWVNGYF